MNPPKRCRSRIVGEWRRNGKEEGYGTDNRRAISPARAWQTRINADLRRALRLGVGTATRGAKRVAGAAQGKARQAKT